MDVKYKHDAEFVKEALERGIIADSESAKQQTERGNTTEAHTLNALSLYKRTLLNELFIEV